MNPLDKKNAPGQEPEILTNLDQTPDPTVVVSEADRSVVLREEETLVVEKPQKVEIIPGNRPRKVYRGMWGPMELGVFRRFTTYATRASGSLSVFRSLESADRANKGENATGLNRSYFGPIEIRGYH